MIKIINLCIVSSLLIIFYVNFTDYYFGEIHKGVQHPVSAKEVSVYKYSEKNDNPKIPTMEFVNNIMVDTGHDVTVYIRYDYEDSFRAKTQGLTIILTIIIALLFFIKYKLNKFSKRSGKN